MRSTLFFLVWLSLAPIHLFSQNCCTASNEKTVPKILQVQWKGRNKSVVIKLEKDRDSLISLDNNVTITIHFTTENTLTYTPANLTTSTRVKTSSTVRYPGTSQDLSVNIPGQSDITARIPIPFIERTCSISEAVVPDVVSPGPYSKYERLKNYMYYYRLKYGLKPTLYFSINYTPLASYRLVTVQDPAFTGYDKVDERSSKESTSYGQNFSVAAGVHFGIAFALYGEYIRTRQGFISEGSAVDWSTGLPVNYSGDNRYRFTANAYGIGITVTAQTRAVRMAGDAGIYYVSMNKYKDGQVTVSGADLASNPLTAPIRRNSVMAKFGIGPSIRLGPTLNLRLIPTVYYQLGSINKKILKTRLYSFGLQCGLSFAGKRGMKASNPPNNNNK